MGFANLNWRQAKALAEAHIKRFTRLLESGVPNVRAGECTMYLEIWRGILAVATPEGWDRASLADNEKGEIQDAIACGDYDELLAAHPSPEEMPAESLLAVKRSREAATLATIHAMTTVLHDATVAIEHGGYEDGDRALQDVESLARAARATLRAAYKAATEAERTSDT